MSLRPPRLRLLSLAVALCAALRAAETPPADYAASIASARATRVAELTKADGWLTLIGLHFLAPGENTVGREKPNAIALGAGPERLGTVTLADDGAVRFAPAGGTIATVDGRPATSVVALKPGAADAKPTLVASDTVTFFLIERGGKKALRVKDSAAHRRTRFAGLAYFPTDASWRIEATWVPFTPRREITITNVLGHTSRETAPGKAVFERDGRTYELVPIQDASDEPLFFVFGDATNGDTTYGMRFLDAGPPRDGRVVLDFNLAENPPCAFTPFATCPLPPPGNRLPLAITAGETSYRGAEH